MGKTSLPTLEALEGEGLEARMLGSSSVPLHHPVPQRRKDWPGTPGTGLPSFTHSLSTLAAGCWLSL